MDEAELREDDLHDRRMARRAAERAEKEAMRAEIERLRGELQVALDRFRLVREGGEAGERALRLAILDLEDTLADEQDAPLTLVTRPVAFRVKVGVAWVFCPTEDEALGIAESNNIDYQGLYIRGGDKP